MAFEIPCREPLSFSAGDTLSFKRYLRDYLPADGWSLAYEVRGGARGDDAVQFASIASGAEHQMTVAAAVTALWLTGEYVLVGYAVNGAERHQVYYGEFQVVPNLGSASNADAVVTTHAQRMIPLIEAQLEEMALHPIIESDIERTKIVRETRKALEDQLARNKEIRANEIALENVRNGRPSGNKISPVMNIIGGGSCWPFSR